MNYTLTYDESVQGWPSFYSFYPDWMIGMNQYFYSFKGGNLYRHNTNETRNNFYGTQYKSIMVSVFNDVPLENKIFKTLNLEGDHAWKATMVTDIQNTGFIEESWFEKKEQSWYAFVRNSGTTPANPGQNYPLRSLNGIGRSASIITTTPSAVIINFSINPLVDIGSIVSVGDIIYWSNNPSTGITYGGKVTNIVKDYPNGSNYIVINTVLPGATIPNAQTLYYLFIKDSVAESHGVFGHYCVFTLENTKTIKSELFAAESEIMKSYP